MVCCGYFRDGQIFDKACAASGSEPEMKKITTSPLASPPDINRTLSRQHGKKAMYFGNPADAPSSGLFTEVKVVAGEVVSKIHCSVKAYKAQIHVYRPQAP